MDLGITRAVGHCGASTRIRVPPDELVIYLVAVDDEPPRVVIESVADNTTTPVIVLDVDQAASLAAGLLASVNTAATGIARREA